MRNVIEAACLCNTGKIRRNNEDNFYFDGKCLEMVNEGLRNPAILEETLKNGWNCAVFDGMGGEAFGERASFAAARRMQQMERSLADYLIPPKKYLNRLISQLNEAVREAQQEMCTEHMACTMVALYFSGRYVYSCNLGDSRAYRLRNGEFLQISVDHTEKRPAGKSSKAPLTQFLGVNSEEMQLEPYIAKGEIRKNDIYLLCSDGLTDMLSNFEIANILIESPDAESAVQRLVQSALEKGGRDNITVIVCRVRDKGEYGGE